jgi:hypothetical protein
MEFTMRRVFLVGILISLLVVMGFATQPATTAAAQSTGGGTMIADPRVDANATLQDAIGFTQVAPPIAGPLQDTRALTPNERQYLTSGVSLQNFIAQYSFVVPASDGWMLGFPFWDDDQGNSWDLSIIGSSTDASWALGHTTANQWQAEQVTPVADFQSLGLTPGAQANWTLLTYNGVVMLADSNGHVLGTVDIGKSGVGDVTVKKGWSPGSGDPAPSVTISVSDFQVWDLFSLQSTAPAVESFPAAGAATSPVLPAVQGTSTLGMVFAHERDAAIGTTPLAAGMYGFMAQAPGDNYFFQSVQANVSDFYTIVTVTNPDDISLPFDAGIGFRSTGDGAVAYVISVRSDGTWELDGFPDAQGTVSGLNSEPGASNTIELLV